MTSEKKMTFFQDMTRRQEIREFRVLRIDRVCSWYIHYYWICAHSCLELFHYSKSLNIGFNFLLLPHFKLLNSNFQFIINICPMWIFCLIILLNQHSLEQIFPLLHRLPVRIVHSDNCVGHYFPSIQKYSNILFCTVIVNPFSLRRDSLEWVSTRMIPLMNVLYKVMSRARICLRRSHDKKTDNCGV